MPSDPTPTIVDFPAATPLPILWEDDESVQPMPSNAFLVQMVPEGILLVFGFAKPPILTGTPEEQQVEAQAITGITVRPGLRVLLPLQRVEELSNLLKSVLVELKARGPVEESDGE
jgi:hypothetical protein